MSEWGYSFVDGGGICRCGEETARAKASLDWSVMVWRSDDGVAWDEVETERPDGTVS
jgi:hypothetical protein